MSTSLTMDEEISERDFQLYQRLFHEAIGLHLPSHKKTMLSGRLKRRLHQLGLNGYHAYYELISKPHAQAELQHAIDLVTTNETFFFRESKHFDVLKHQIIPQHPAGRPLRIWSGACSTGEEPYSIAMILHAMLGPAGWELIASDISSRVLAHAARGLYAMERISGIPPELLKSYCLRGRGEYEGMLLVDKILREKVLFRTLNLMTVPQDIGVFDVVFLRNVIIYFDPPTKLKVLRSVLDRLRPDGWLFLGHSESLAGMDLPVTQIAPSVFRRSVRKV